MVLRGKWVPPVHVCTELSFKIFSYEKFFYFFPLLAPFLDLFTAPLPGGLLFLATTGFAAAFLAAGFFAGAAFAFFLGAGSTVLHGDGGPLFPFLGLYASSSSSSSDDSSSLSDSAARFTAFFLGDGSALAAVLSFGSTRSLPQSSLGLG